MRTETRGTQVADPAPAVSQETDPRPLPERRIAPRHLVFKYGFLGLLASGGCFWDLWSKWSVFSRLGCPGRQSVWRGSIAGISIDFDLATTFNRGALWGIGQNQTWLFASLSFVAVAVIVYFLFTRQAVASWWLTVATGLLLAGTLGNLFDRLGLHGWNDDQGRVYAVRDFLDFVFSDGAFHWATFNFADVFLVTGAIMLVLMSLFTSNDQPAVNVTDTLTERR